MALSKGIGTDKQVAQQFFDLQHANIDNSVAIFTSFSIS
jgi:hypothetical protein